VSVGPTGTIACSLEGQTIHSFAGCGVPVTIKDLDQIWKIDRRKAWRKVRVMLTDEISMMSSELLDNLQMMLVKSMIMPMMRILVLVMNQTTTTTTTTKH
jgi:hypothetical protein